ncbi:inositol polyphosphate 5-phosphatase 11 [Tasmannia lanceolata]|uniref:inositol polyphosphate 5-phosphatase 11 n=1 Tax=Tasmannia lanceolata TaxID=3420 RepID=UPI004063BA26
MGNYNSAVHGERRRSRSKNKIQANNSHQATHEGIKTVRIENLCKFPNTPVLCMCILTWNMNGRKVSSKDLAELIARNRESDLFVIGLQEAPRRNVRRLLQAALDCTHSLLGEAIMQSLQLFIFGPKNSKLFTEEIRVHKHAVGGFGGIIGRKKGAVAISIIFKGVRMVFISCHLSAHAHNVEERNSQCRRIFQSIKKNRNPYSRPPHITVWLGDLNYRIQGIDTLPARSLIQDGLHSLLTSKDQLLQEAERGNVFDGYCEGTLAFKPTYKYNIGSSNYDTSYKVRVPSWTDRILFKIEKVGDIGSALQSYESIDNIYSSDHKPVKAHLCLTVNESQIFPPSNAVQ